MQKGQIQFEVGYMPCSACFLGASLNFAFLPADNYRSCCLFYTD